MGKEGLLPCLPSPFPPTLLLVLLLFFFSAEEAEAAAGMLPAGAARAGSCPSAVVRPWPPHRHLALVQGLRLQSLRHTKAPFRAWSWPWSARPAGAELSGAVARHRGRRTAPTGAPAAPPALNSHTSSTEGDGGWERPFPLPWGINGQWGIRGMGFVLGRGQRCKALKPRIRGRLVPPRCPSPHRLLLAPLAPADQALQTSLYSCPRFHLLPLSLPWALVKAACWGLINLAGSANSDQLKGSSSGSLPLAAVLPLDIARG